MQLTKWVRYTISLSILLYQSYPVFANPSHKSELTYSIQGITGSILNNVNIRLKETKKELVTPDALQVQSWYLQSQQVIQNTLKAFGYFKAEVHAQLDKNLSGYHARYHITLGPLLLISQLNIQLQGDGEQNKILQNIIKELSSKKGQGMTTETYQFIKRTLYKTAMAEGYLDAAWTQHVVLINMQNYTATINLTLNTGAQYKIGNIQFAENPLNTDFLMRYLPFKKGDPYRLSEILNVQTILKNTGYFQQASIHTPVGNKTHAIPLKILLSPAPKYYYTVGGGLSTDLGAHFKAEGLIRRVTASGHQIAATAQFSRTQKSFLGLYTIPGDLPNEQQHHIQVERTQHYLNQIKADIYLIGWLFTHQYGKWKVTRFLNLHQETFKNPSDINPTKVFLLMPGLNISQIKTDWYKTIHNYKIHLQIQGAIKPLLSNINLLKSECEVTYFGSLKKWSQYSYVVSRIRLGHIFTDDFEKTPPSLAFYAGGHRYPRGYEEYKLGKNLFSTSIEYRHHLMGLFYLTPFFDISNTSYQEKAFFKGSTGIGLCLWYPSIGNIEVSYVKPYNPSYPHASWKLIGRITTDL